MKRLAAYMVVVMSTLVVLLVLWHFRTVVVLFALSLFVAAAVRPVISELTKRGIPAGLAMIITYLSGLSLVGLWVYIVSQSMTNEIQSLLNDIARRYEMIHPMWLEGTTLQQALAARLPLPSRFYEALAAEEGTILAQSLITVIRSILTAIASFVIILVLSIYWAIDRAHFEQLWLSLIPAIHRVRAREIWHAVENGVGGYIRSEAVQGFMAVMLLAIGYLIMGINYPTLLALLGVIAWLLPIVGFIFAVIPALLVGLATSPLLGVAAGFYTLAIFLLMERFVEPRLFRQRHLYSSLFVVLLMIPLFDAYGFIGLFAASPIAVAIEIFLVKLFSPRRHEVEHVYPSDRIAELEQKVAQIRSEAEAADGDLAPEMASLLERLVKLLDRAEEAVQQEVAPHKPGPPSPGHT